LEVRGGQAQWDHALRKKQFTVTYEPFMAIGPQNKPYMNSRENQKLNLDEENHF